MIQLYVEAVPHSNLQLSEPNRLGQVLMDEMADNRPEMSITNVVIEVGNNILLREKAHS